MTFIKKYFRQNKISRVYLSIKIFMSWAPHKTRRGSAESAAGVQATSFYRLNVANKDLVDWLEWENLN